MRGTDEQTATRFSYLSPDALVPADHPLHSIRPLVNAALERLSPQFSRLYSLGGRASIAPEKLLRALLLEAFYGVRPERQWMEQGHLQHAVPLVHRAVDGCAGVGCDRVDQEPRAPAGG